MHVRIPGNGKGLKVLLEGDSGEINYNDVSKINECDGYRRKTMNKMKFSRLAASLKGRHICNNHIVGFS